MKTVSKFVLAAFAAMTLVTAAAQADDNTHRHGGSGVVISQDNVLSSQLAHDAQGE